MSKEFDDFMDKVKGYPELEGTMNLCNDIINSREISDEEIEQGAEKETCYMNDFIKGAKWYREQIRIRNEEK